MAAPPSFYMRTLPRGLASFASSEGRDHFRRALHQGNMESYFDLACQYVTQSRPEDCARSTLVMVLNTLNLDPGKVWMNPWRWYAETVLNCLDPKPGMSLHEFARTAMCNGTWVQAYYPLGEKRNSSTAVHDTSCGQHSHESRLKFASEQTFRVALKASVRRTGLILVVNHSRPGLGQTGDGHYSPIAGLDEETDKCLVMDVARFKYPAFWVPVSKLYQSLEWIDNETGKMRGFLMVARTREFSTTCRVTMDSTSLSRIKSAIHEDLLKTAPADVLPLLYYCYYSLSDLFDAQNNSELLTQIEQLKAFASFNDADIHPGIKALSGEIAETHSRHFLALVQTALEDREEGSSLIKGHIERLKAELGVRRKALG